MAGAQSMFKPLTHHGIRLLKPSPEKYNDWLVKEKINNETEADNLKAPPRKEILKWILTLKVLNFAGT